MTTLLKRLSRGVFIIAVAGGLSIGLVQAVRGLPVEPCGHAISEMGECPPFNDNTCFGACYLAYETGGECIPHEAGPDCCTCFMP